MGMPSIGARLRPARSRWCAPSRAFGDASLSPVQVQPDGSQVLVGPEGGGAGGFLEHIYKHAARELFGVTVDTVPFVVGRNADLREATLEVDGKPVLRFATAYGFRNIQNLVRKVKGGKAPYHFVEIMACPSGSEPPPLRAKQGTRGAHPGVGFPWPGRGRRSLHQRRRPAQAGGRGGREREGAAGGGGHRVPQHAGAAAGGQCRRRGTVQVPVRVASRGRARLAGISRVFWPSGVGPTTAAASGWVASARRRRGRCCTRAITPSPSRPRRWCWQHNGDCYRFAGGLYRQHTTHMYRESRPELQ